VCIEELFHNGVREGIFTDFDVSVRGDFVSDFKGGTHVAGGAHLFDVASITKACAHLLLLLLFVEKKLSPQDKFSRYLDVPHVRNEERELWHFLCYVVQSYAFDYEALRDGTTSGFKDKLLAQGFGHWGKRFLYDNISSTYLSLLIEEIFKADLEEVFRSYLLPDPSMKGSFIFHPVHRGIIPSVCVVPTQVGPSVRGIVHDPLSSHHQNVNLAVAGIFSNAVTLAEVFHEGIDRVISSGFFETVARNQLDKLGITENRYGLGFDLPFKESLSDLCVEGAMIFSGWTGCRVFFAKKPRVTIVFLTNRVLCEESAVSRRRFSQFSWTVIRRVLQDARR